MKVVIHKFQEKDGVLKPPGIYDTARLPRAIAINALMRDVRERASAPDHDQARADCTAMLLDALRVASRRKSYEDDVESLIEAYERIIRE